MPTDFSKAKIGDKVADRFRQKNGIIEDINRRDDTYPISVRFEDRKRASYMTDGRVDERHAIPALVWAMQKPEDDWSILPEMSKRMVKKKVEGWINIYPTDVAYKDKETAISRRYSNHLGEPLFISHEYEVEED